MRDPYRVLLKYPNGVTRMAPAKSRAEAVAIAEHWKAEHGEESQVFRWNADDQRYLLVPRRR